MGEWAEERGIELKFIQPGSPHRNGYVERFNKRYQEDVLDAFSFTRVKEANALSQARAWIYNNERSHNSGVPTTHDLCTAATSEFRSFFAAARPLISIEIALLKSY